MARMGFVFIIFLLLLSFSSCSSPTFPKHDHDCSTIATVYSNCENLPTLNSTLQYYFNPSNSTLSVVFEAAPPHIGGWVAWGLNPTNLSMIGAQVIVSYKNDNGMVIKTYDIRSHFLFVPGKLHYETWGLKAEEEAGRFKIYANVKIPPNIPVVYHVWQSGPRVTKDGTLVALDIDQENLQSTGELRLFSSSDVFWRKTHGWLNVVGWSILRPLGLVVSRYGPKVKLGDPYWFYAYIFFQSSGSVVGYAGFISGVLIGSRSEKIQFYGHLILGITMVIFDVIQIVIVCRKPNEYPQSKTFWVIAFILTVFTVVNSHLGMEISNTAHKWVVTYDVWIGILTLPLWIELGKLVAGCIKQWKRYGPVDVPDQSGMQPEN